ncbi:MAG TPA: hypothetical protein VHY19_00380 [Steroidobacteraceae bacterium]|nr:hypothetical protein [Steroidobacteraceae bacterium]
MLLGIVASNTALSATSGQVAPIDLGANVAHLKVSQDGSRALAQLVSPLDGHAIGLRVLDLAPPNGSRMRGIIPIDADQMALAADGRRALTVSVVTYPRLLKPGAYSVVSWDLADPDHPKSVSTDSIIGSAIFIAGDASAYAAVRFTPDAKSDIDVRWLNHAHSEMTIEANSAPFLANDTQFSADAHFLGYKSFGGVVLYDLRSETAVRYAQASGVEDHYRCGPIVLADGRMLLADDRAPVFDLYAPAPGLPRIATLPFDGDRCQPLLNAGLHEGEPLIFAAGPGTIEVTVPQQGTMLAVKQWSLPPDQHAVAVSKDWVYALSGASVLRMFPRGKDVASPTDWPAILRIYQQVMQRYAAERGRGTSGSLHAYESLTSAGIVQALEAPVPDAQAKAVAAMFNDFGFLAARDGFDVALGERALRRALAIDPMRRLAALNLATLLEEKWHGGTAAQRAAVGQEIQTNYARFRELGGEANPGLERFTQMLQSLRNPSPISSGAFCRFIADAANDDTLSALVGETASDVVLAGQHLDLAVMYGGTAHIPQINAFEAGTDTPVDPLPFRAPGVEDLTGDDRLNLLMYGGITAIVHDHGNQFPEDAHSLDGSVHCQFETAVMEVVDPKSAEPALCRKIAQSGPPNVVDFAEPATIDQKTVEKTYYQTAADGMSRLDVANDGHAVAVVKLDLASTGGAGCEAEFYDVSTDDGTQLVAGAVHDQLLALQQARPGFYRSIVPHCSNRARFFRANGQIYFENKPQIWPPTQGWDEYHQVAKISHGAVSNVCDFHFKSQTTVSQ